MLMRRREAELWAGKAEKVEVTFPPETTYGED